MYCFLCFTRPLRHHKSSNLLRRTRLDGAVEHAEVRILHLFILCFRYPWQRGDLEVTQEWTGGIYIARQFQEGKVTAFSCLFCRESWKILQISWKRPLFCFFVHVHTWRWFIVDLLSTFGFASFCHFSHRPNHSNLILHCSASPQKQAW